MKKYILLSIIAFTSVLSMNAQSALYKVEGYCGKDIKWSFDGYTLFLQNVNKNKDIAAMPDYDLKRDVAPWVKKKLNLRKVEIGDHISRIGSCAFANCKNLQEVVFNGIDVEELGWGAFLNCDHLRNLTLPLGLKTIGTIAFANCSSLTAVSIPDRCRVSDQAFVSCTKLQNISIGPTAILGHHVFATEVTIGSETRHALYNGEIRKFPQYINENNCNEYGLSANAIRKFSKSAASGIDYDIETSDVDTNIPVGYESRTNTYVLVIGNQNYRFVSNVPYAIHDARVFADYCEKTLGVPPANIHITEDATKQMILEEELEDWAKSISSREDKNLIVYYAGHGVPDIRSNNKAYLLPTDVRGTNPQRGIALDDFYAKIGALDFAQTSVFLDACFSGVNRDNEGVTEGLRGVAIKPQESSVGNGKIVVFSAAQGNETAQGFPEEGHGLFTYYLLKEMQTTNGNVDFGVLSDNLKRNVSQKSMEMKLRKSQTPQTTASDAVGANWKSMRF